MNGSLIQDVLVQVGLALAYYAVLVTIMRLAGKRLAGQTTTFDLVILITISVVLPNIRTGKNEIKGSANKTPGQGLGTRWFLQALIQNRHCAER